MEEYSDNEREQIRKMKVPGNPPDHLRRIIINELKHEGLIKSGNPHLLRWAAGLALLVIGFSAGRWMQPERTAINPEQGYMLLLHEDRQFSPGPPHEMFEEYSNWMNSLSEMGVKIDGQELVPESITVKSDKAVSEANPDDRVTGYFLIQADSEEEALKVANNNPHLKYGGTIEIKKFMVR